MAHPTQRITPYLLYEDLPGALEWLAKAFGLSESLRHAGPDGALRHAEMTLGEDGVVMLGWPGPQFRNPKRLGAVTQNLFVRVEDVDACFERAVRAGAVILEKPCDHPSGDRRCGVEDPEGHRWYLAARIV